jgi:arginyl-tRNA synthetase
LLDVVRDFEQRGLARESDGATCVFLDGFETPMIIRKKDGAFLYATTDLATIRFRMQTWHPDVILYVVDHRQSEHFEKLFAAARLWGYDGVELRHIRFGTVMGPDGTPYKTRSGDTVGLEGLLDRAVARAHQVVCENDDARPEPELSAEERRQIAYVIGHAAIKYFDLSHNREADYRFDEDQMVALQGNTATYMQYCYARTQSIFARGEVDVDRLRAASPPILLADPLERTLALELLRCEEVLEGMLVDYRPNLLTSYLFVLAQAFHKFFDKCSVLKAPSDQLRSSRLVLCDLVGRTIKQGLNLLGIDVVQKM